jgi:hypothetical protein
MHPNHTNSAPPRLPIPDDNEGVVKDVYHTINDQTPTFYLISPDVDILQAIRMTIKAPLPVRTEIAHVKGHQDRHKQWDELDIRAQMNMLADRQADAISYRKSPLDGPVSFRPGYRGIVGQVTKGIPAYIRDAKHTPVMKEYLLFID